MNTHNTNGKFYEIVNGPSKDTLFDSCKYSCSKTSKVEVKFSIAAGYTVHKDSPMAAFIPMETKNWLIAGIENEDDTGEKLQLRGYCEADIGVFGIGNGEMRIYKFNAHYNTKTRKGVITLSVNLLNWPERF